MLLVTLKPYIEMLEEVAGVNHSKSNQTSSCCTFLHKSVATTSGSGYHKAANSWTVEECIRNITTSSPCPLGIFLLPFSPWNAKWIGIPFLQEQRAEEQLHWIRITFCGE